MKNRRFSIIEMIIVISIILILIAMAFPYIKDAQLKAKKAATRNHLNQIKEMVSAYLTDYKVLPLSNHVNSGSYSDTTTIKYWTRVPDNLFQLNSRNINNAELIYDKFENPDLTIKSENAFDAKYPTKNINIPLDSWYTGPKSDSNLHEEELKTVSHSSRFLNYYLCGTGFDLNESVARSYQSQNWLGDENTSFKPSTIQSGLIKNFLYAFKNETILYYVGMKDYTPAVPDIAELNSKEFTVPDIIPVTHYGISGKEAVIYKDYLPKILGFWNKQRFSSNLLEDSFRRLYVFNDETKSVPLVASEFSPKYKTLPSDRILQNIKYSAKGINYSNTHIGVHMKAHVHNVKQIVDAFNTPIVYITFANQRKESARTFKSTDPKILDKSLPSDSFVLYSLGPNKMDNSNLGEKHLDGDGTGDDIIESMGTR